MLDLLTKSLLDRYRRRSLGHFYILNANEEEQLSSWTHQFLINILSDEGASKETCERRLKQGHPDILWLAPTDGSYKIENKDFDPLFQAMAHKPLELPWRFIVVEKPDAIGDAYANKLLKTLEEPSDFCTIIFLHAGARSLLATIESRGINLNLPNNATRELPTPSKDQNLADYLGSWSQHYPELYDSPLELTSSSAALAGELATLSRSKSHIEANLMAAVMTWAEHSIEDGRILEEVIEAMQHNYRSKIYNNSTSERFFSLISAVLATTQS